MFGLQVWEIVIIATGAFWGAWFMYRRTKKQEEEQRKLEEERNRKHKRR